MNPSEANAPRSSIRVLIADDHAMVRNGIRAFLATQADIVIVGEAADAETAARLCADLKPDVALLDLRMPAGGGIAAARSIAEATPGTRTVMLTSFDGASDIRAAIDAGVLSWVMKDIAALELAEVIRKARRDEAVWHPRAAAVLQQTLHEKSAPASPLADLSPRERGVLDLIAEGLNNAEIADRLGIGEKTVKTHVSNVLAKLGLSDRTQVAVAAWREGWVGKRAQAAEPGPAD